MNELVISGVKMLKPSGEVEIANIHVSGDKISKISRGEVVQGKIIDGKGKFATPGLVNAHTHASMTLLRSYSDDKSLMDWLNKDIWPIEAKMTRKDIYWGAKLAAVEMIRG